MTYVTMPGKGEGKRITGHVLFGKALLGWIPIVATAISLILLAVPLYGEPIMYAHFISVGQANATLLEFPCGAVLIDAGSQDDAYTDSLIRYLDRFFRNRKDLNRTLNTVFITHNHIDHTLALKSVIEHYKVLNYIDNGQLEGPGTANPRWVRKYAEDHPGAMTILDITDSEITALKEKRGLTNPEIDPIECQDCDPEIRVLSGRLDENPGWPQNEFDNKNNQSLVIRVDFGESSLLFTGDLEVDAIGTLLDWYDSTTVLDADVYEVGHHGSYNGTTEPLLEAISPDIAVISCGAWDWGMHSTQQFTTYAYGHPRKNTLDLLSMAISGKRNPYIKVKAATAAKVFEDYRVKKRIYATPWDGNVKIRCTLAGDFTVTRKN